ncbi:helix-turn-helix domain-containing protein [Streptomyces sp. NA04227]|uniref:helix-turn-helix domain-containing protein n=1 Tax=Streptomyces sp. NA04227 TaxID=2742136 RepID=UPI0020CA899B|nr:helix-turn-helix domain-containing protein [Streptomyces sp. NA04227]
MQSTHAYSRLPWRELPAEFADVLRPRIDEITALVAEAIRQEVPAYRHTPHSSVSRDLITAVQSALHQFAELTENPDSVQQQYESFFRRLGRREFLGGRTTDGLQAAYRVGARVACRRYVELAREAGFPAEVALSLNEAVLTHINAMSDQVVQGFAGAQARSAGQVQRLRRALAARLLEQTPVPRGEPVSALAERAGWPLPATVAALIIRPTAEGNRPLSALDDDVLVLPQDGSLHLIVPEPDSDGRMERLRAAARGLPGALGPVVPLEEAWLSLHCARLAFGHHLRRTASAAGAAATPTAATTSPASPASLAAPASPSAPAAAAPSPPPSVTPSPATAPTPADELIVAADRLLDVHLLNSRHIGRLLADRALAPLHELPPGKAARLAETLDALLLSWGRTAPEVADALHIHPQTARNRLRQLDELFGPRLTDPTAPDLRIGALLALRTRALREARAEE